MKTTSAALGSSEAFLMKGEKKKSPILSLYSCPYIPSSFHCLCSSISLSDCTRCLSGSQVFLTSISRLKVSQCLASLLPPLSLSKTLRYLYLRTLSHQQAFILALCTCCIVQLFVCGKNRFSLEIFFLFQRFSSATRLKKQTVDLKPVVRLLFLFEAFHPWNFGLLSYLCCSEKIQAGLECGQNGLASQKTTDTGRTPLLQPHCYQQRWNARERKVLRLAQMSKHREEPPCSAVSDPPGAPPPGLDLQQRWRRREDWGLGEKSALVSLQPVERVSMPRLETPCMWSSEVLKLTITSSFAPSPEGKLRCPQNAGGWGCVLVCLCACFGFTTHTLVGCPGVLLSRGDGSHRSASKPAGIRHLSTRYRECKQTFQTAQILGVFYSLQPELHLSSLLIMTPWRAIYFRITLASI